jgi:acyl carrier protein
MNFEKKVTDVISQVTGIPRAEISNEKNLTKDLGISEIELQDIISEISRELSLPLTPERELKTVQDLILLIQDNQLIA